MRHRQDYERFIGSMLQAALKQGLLGEEEPLLYLIDFDRIRLLAHSARSAFPSSTRHCFAVKANPLPAVLRLFHELGFGLECASIEEVLQALRSTGGNGYIVYDGPCKTRSELREALALGVHINADNLDELDRIASLLAESPGRPHGNIGIRINPQLAAGSIAATSTATAAAKFGVPLREQREALMAAIHRHAFVSGLHCHMGSGGMSFDKLTAGMAAVFEFAQDLRQQGRKLEQIDIGGGVPIEYGSTDLDDSPSFGDYFQALQHAIPHLGDYRIITEFGRSLIGHAGTILSRIEYMKKAGGHHIATMHFGADMLVWTAYTHEHLLRLPFAIYDDQGRLHLVESDPQESILLDLAGPLCFTDDMAGFARHIPTAALPRAGDHLAMFAAGAYTLAVWSKFNSRSTPPVAAIDGGKLRQIKPRESLEDNLRFWGPLIP